MSRRRVFDLRALIKATGTPELPAWWIGHVLAWLLVLVISTTAVASEPIGAWRRGAAVALMSLLAVAYVWLSLYGAPRYAEPASDRPDDRISPQRWLLIAGLLVMALLVVALVALVPTAGLWWESMYIVVAAGLVLPARAAAATMLVVLVATLLGARALTGAADPRLLILCAIGGAAVALRHLAVTVEQLRLAREALARRAVDEERTRIARDLHDLLGHSLSLVAIKSELAGRLLPLSPEDAAAEVRDIEHAARDALQQVRLAVIGYRQPTLAGELLAASELLTAAGVNVTIAQSDLDGLSPSVNGVLAWTVREAVTNVVRHSRAEYCEIHVGRNTKCAWVCVADDGQGPAPSADMAWRPSVLARGSGLAGLQERANAVGAVLAIDRGPLGGCRVTLEVSQ